MVKKLLLGFLSAIIFFQAPALAAGDLYSVDVRQIYCFKDLIRIYTNIEDANSNPIDVPSASDISGYIDSNKLTPRSSARFSDSGEGVADIFLVDSSGSMRDSQMVQVKNAIKTWVSNMKPNDRIAVISFGDNVEVRTDYSNDAGVINNAVDSITNNGRQTQLYGGIMEALKLTDRNDSELPKRKNIILITDGVNDYNGGISENDMYKELKSRLIPVYCMWMSGSKESGSKGMATMNSVADYSGGTMYDMTGKKIDTVYSWIRQSIMNSCVIDFNYDSAGPDNNEHVLNLRISQKDKMAEDNVRFIMKKSDEDSGTYRIDTVKGTNGETVQSTAEPADDKDDSNRMVLILCILGGVLLLAIIAAVITMLSRKKDTYYDDMQYTSGNLYTQNESASMPQNTVYAPAGAFSVTVTSMKTGKESRLQLSDAITIGRDPSNTLVLSEPTVSGNHAVMTRVDGRIYIEDMSSKNGTLRNGCVVNGIEEIQSGDIISFGNDEYRIQF